MTKNTLEVAGSDRAAYVSQQLAKITTDTKKNFFTVCDLMLEFFENDYHKFFGYTRFGEWVENAGLEIGSRQAYYYVTIGKRARDLGLDKEKLLEIPISNLKEILSLDPEKYETEIRGLLEEADSLSTEEVKDKVRGLKSDKGEEVYVNYNFKVSEFIKEILEEAFELCRRNHGNTVDTTTGEVIDITNSKCLELICVEYLQSKDNYPENSPVPDTLPVVEG